MGIENTDDLKPEVPAYTPPHIELPEEPREHDDDPFDEEVGTAEDVEADFDAPETNAKEV